MPFQEVRVLGVRVHCLAEGDVLSFVEERMRLRQYGQIATINAEIVMRAHREPRFASTLENVALSTPDGAGVVWAMRRHGIAQNGRVGGSDLIYSMSEHASRHGYRVYYLGAAPGVAEEVARRMTAKYPALVVAGTFSGSPSVDDDVRIVHLVRQSAADILFVAFGAPNQEMWLGRNLANTGAMVGIGVGGSFDYVAGRARRAPLWMQQHGLDWLWRLVRQPTRWRRMTVLPRFVWLVVHGR